MQRIAYLKSTARHLIGNNNRWTSYYLNDYNTTHCDSFHRDFEEQSFKFQSHGAIYNKNRIEDFKTCDKMALISEEGRLIWDDIVNGRCLDTPSLFTRFVVLSFAVSIRLVRIPFQNNSNELYHAFLCRIWNHSIITIGLRIRVRVNRSSSKLPNAKQSPPNFLQFNYNNWPIFTFNWRMKCAHFSFWNAPTTRSNISNWQRKLMWIEKMRISRQTICPNCICAFRIQAQAMKMLDGHYDCFYCLLHIYGVYHIVFNESQLITLNFLF